MSPAGQRLWSSIAAARRQVRRDGLVAAAGVVAAVIPAILVVAWTLGATPAWLAPSPAPLILVGLALVIACGVAAWAIRRWVLSVDDLVVASAAEARRGLPAGSVRCVLELSRALPAGASPSLYGRAESDLARQLAGATTVDLSGSVGELARRRRMRCLVAFGGLGLLAAVLGFVSPERSRMGWSALVSPVAHLSPPPMPALVVEPGDVELPRGANLDVAIQAPGRREVTLRWRAAGDVSRQRRLSVDEDRASTRLSAIDAEMVYWVIAPDGAVSDTFRVTPLDPLLFSDLVVDVIYPSYLGREPERFEDEVPPLEIPAGTELHFRGRATRQLEEAALRRADGSTRVDFEVTGNRFSGRWTPRASGAYAWALADRNGGIPAATPPPLELTVVPDNAPSVEITFPGPDTLLGPEMRQAVVADARDDHGLYSATLVSWRVSALGGRDEPIEQRVDLQGDADRAILRTIIDARERRLLPGDELHYFVRVVDASPMRQVGESETHVLRLPSMEELRRRADEQAESLVEDASELARTAREMEENTRDLARQTARTAQGGSSGQASGSRSRGGNPGGQKGGEGSLDYEQREQARHALAQQEAMIERVERMRERTQALQRAMEAAGLQDPALQGRLSELQQLYDQILTPELKEKMEQLRNSIDEMDPEEAQQALEQLAEQQEELRRQIDQSLELLRRAALEQQMNAAAREAQELAAQQEALAEAMSQEEQPSPERAQQQQELMQRASKLQELMQKLQQQLSRQGEEKTAGMAGDAAEEMDSARQSMQRASQQAQNQQGQEAGQSGKQAAQQLEQVAQSLESARESMAEGWRNETREAVEQAANDALELAQRQQELLEQMRQAQQGGQLDQSLPQPQPGQQQEGQDQGGQGAQQGQQGQQGQQSGQQGGDQGQQGQQGQGQQGEGQQGGGEQGQGQQGQGQSGQSGNKSQSGEQGQSQGQQGQQGQPGGGQQGGSQQGGSTSQMQTMRQQQAALQQSLEALGRNLAEAGRRSAMVNPDVGAALSRAMLSMQQTLEAMQGQDGRQGMPTEQARQTVEALNRLALELLENGEEIEKSQSGTGVQQALEQLAELAKQQGSLNGQANSLLPMGLGPQAMADRMERMAREQRDLAKKLGGLNDMVGGQDDVFGQLDELAREAEAIAQDLSGGRLSPELLARQERLFHRLLDAGRTLEREEYTDERVGERAGNVGVSQAPPLDAELLYGGPRYPVPDAEALRDLPPAYRRLILEYFDRLNRQSASDPAASGAGADAAGGNRPRGQNQNR